MAIEIATETISEDTEAQETAQGTEAKEIDWKAEARKWEERSKSNKAELDELKKQFEAKDETKAEDTKPSQSDADAAIAAEFGIAADEKAGTEEKPAANTDDNNAAIEKANLEVLRLKVALKHGISEEDTELFLTGTTPELLNKQAEALSKRSAPKVKPDAGQGKKTAAPTSNRDAFAALMEEQLH